MFILYDKSYGINDGWGGRIYGIFSTMDKAKAYVKDVLGKDVEWGDPKHTMTGSIKSYHMGKRLPNEKVYFGITPAPVEPEEFPSLPYNFG